MSISHHHLSRAIWQRACILLLLAMGVACTPTREILDTVVNESDQPAVGARSYAIYLIGDAGGGYTDTTQTALPLLGRMLDGEGFNSTVVFLGDNIYPSGMPAPEHPDRSLSETLMDKQLDAVDDYKGQVVFLPGNHDWGGQGLGGDRDALRRQELYVEDKLDRGNSFLPDNGFPGPVEVALNDEITLVVLDTQWWLEPERPFGDTDLYEVDQIGRVLIELDDVIQRNEGKRIVVVGHHPILSNGEHGGYFNTLLSPVSLARRYLGVPQDFSNYGYRRLRKALFNVFEEHPGLMYAAGHDHSLQHFKRKEQHYIVSGSGSKSAYVAENDESEYVSSRHGFARLMFYTDGSIWLEFWSAIEGSDRGEKTYAVQLEAGNRPLVSFAPSTTVNGELLVPEETMVVSGEAENDDEGDEEQPAARPTRARDQDSELLVEPYLFVSKGTATVIAGDYDIPGILNGLLGARYRKIWSSLIEVPIIDLEKTAGGLTPIKRGGGFQTTSLRLEGRDGDQYVLRSVNKDASAVLPDFLRDTVVDDYVEDQTSGMHPFGAFVVSPLAEAAGIYHTEPTLVMIPDDERLGIYREALAGTLALFETRPDEEQRDEGRFGRPENIVGSTRMLQKVQERNEHRVDAPFFARARLFDMLAGDWDRHQDQWRWAEFEPYELYPNLTGPERKRGTLYRPIPRDRDFAFFRPEGVLSDAAQAFGGLRLRTAKFGPRIKHLRGLNFSASNLDFQFLSPLTREDWVRIAEEVQEAVNDDVIEQAVRRLPGPAFDISGAELIKNLKLRRDQLPEIAERYYLLLAREVDVVGSNESEEFYVERLDRQTVRVRMYRLSRNGIRERELFSRTFYDDETREIHLYGLGGLDRFVFEGPAEGVIKVRAVGGYGVDTFSDNGDGFKHNHVHDTPGRNLVYVNRPARVNRHTDPRASIYPGHRFRQYALLPTFGYRLNSEDGIFLGTGVTYTHSGFLRHPYKSKNKVLFRQSLFTRAFIASYEGHFPAATGPWGGWLNAEYYGYNNIRNFYGYGNNSDGSEANRLRYRAQYSQVLLEPRFTRRLSFFRTIELGFRLEYTNVDPIPGGPQGGTAESGYSMEDMREKMYAGVKLAFNIDGTDSLTVTRSGARWLNSVSLNQGVYNTNRRYATLASELSYFYPISASGAFSLAFRIGGAYNIGSFEFYQANYLSGRQNVRGYEKNRFAGRSNFYNNFEVRARLMEYNVYFLTGELGLLGFFDHGRVWADEDTSQLWHAGYGGGLWVIPLPGVVANATYGVSREGPLLDFFLRFLF